MLLMDSFSLPKKFRKWQICVRLESNYHFYPETDWLSWGLFFEQVHR
jgi:hypothetical protein